MPFLDKDKLTVTLVLEKDVLMPGETLYGSMNIAVIEHVKCTALRLQVRGEEMMYKRKQQQGTQVGQVSTATGSHVERHTHEIVNRSATVMGEQSGRGARGSVELDPGSYSYPFSIVLPMELPPTYSLEEYRYGGYVRYVVKAIVDIPMGFDNVVEWPITVVKNAPLSQVYEARAAPAVVQPVRADIATCGCAGCYCSHEEDSYILTTALAAPYVAVVHRNAAAPFAPSTAAVPPLPQQQQKQEQQETAASEAADCGAVAQSPMSISGDPSVITLRVLVSNCTTASCITSARVKLTQHLTYRNGVDHATRLADHVIRFDKGPLQPGQSTAFDCTLSVGGDSGNPVYVLPTFAAHFTQVRTELAVEYPEVKADGTLLVRDFIKLVSGIDTTNTALQV